jgi:nucleotide-binding universal stress UspA family protein
MQPFAVVMGTKGAGALERLIIGSNTLFAIKRLLVPVFIIPHGALYKTIKKIGFACDFTKVQETTPVDEIEVILKTFNASLYVLNVDYNEKHFTGEFTLETTELHELLQHLHPTFNYINSVDVEEGINSFADANSIDVLLTIPKKHNFLENIFHKSKSEDLVLHSHLPIIAIHE